MYFNPKNIPSELKEHNQWVAWKANPKNNGKMDKIPINPKTGTPANHSDPGTWSSFDEALNRMQQDHLAGVGFVFSESSPFVGVDLDDCINVEQKEIMPNALKLLQELNSYAEISPSGRGVKVFMRGRLPGPGKKVNGFEMYDHSRFFTVTGAKLNGVPSTIETRNKKIEELYWMFFSDSVDAAGWNGNAEVSQNLASIQSPGRVLNKCHLLRFLKAKADGGVSLGHDTRIALGSLAIALGDLETDGMPFITHMLEGCPDFNPQVTRKHLKSLKGGSPWGCEKLREQVSLEFSDFQKDRCSCNLKPNEGQKPSPIRLAYSSDRRKKSHKQKEPTQSEILLEIANGITFFHTPDRRVYAEVEVDDHTETISVRSKDFRHWLAFEFYKEMNKSPSSQAMEDALNTLTGRGLFVSPEKKVHIRLAEHDGNFYLDLCNEKWEAAEITQGGWRVIAKPPVEFRRARGMLPLPYPIDGSFEHLRPLLNIQDEEAWQLILGWLIAAVRPRGPYPVLTIHGEQGAAKTTMARFLKTIIDSSSLESRTIPMSEHDLMISASNSWVLSFDNLTSIPEWLSQGLCRLSTGGGLSTRQLYTDDEEAVFTATRPVILNGIDGVIRRPDLLDRAIIVTLPPIPEERRHTQENLDRLLETTRPKILGAILNAVSCGLRAQGSVTLQRMPRMADFAKWVVACEGALPWKSGEFLTAYNKNRIETVDLSLDADLVGSTIREMISAQESWEGTASELLDHLESIAPERYTKLKIWPKAPNSLSHAIKTSLTFMRSAGIEIQFLKRGTRKLIQIRRTSQALTDGIDRTDHPKNYSNSTILDSEWEEGTIREDPPLDVETKRSVKSKGLRKL